MQISYFLLSLFFSKHSSNMASDRRTITRENDSVQEVYKASINIVAQGTADDLKYLKLVKDMLAQKNFIVSLFILQLRYAVTAEHQSTMTKISQ